MRAGTVGAISLRCAAQALALAAVALAAAGGVAAQACLGVPIGPGEYAVELQYSKVWVNRGLGAALNLNLPGPLALQASYTRPDTDLHGGGARLAWELAGRSYSACPTLGASYVQQTGRALLLAPVGIALGKQARADTRVPITLYTFPHALLAIRNWARAVDDAQAETEIVPAAELGVRFGGRSMYGGVSTTILVRDDAWPYFSVTAGMPLGGRSPPSTAAARALVDGTVRDRFGISAGVLSGDAGPNLCYADMGLSLGAEIRTTGRWLAAGSAEMLAPSSYSCLSIATTIDYNGQ